MIKPIADLLTEPGQSRYALCVGVSKRSREIAEKAEAEHIVMDEKPVEIAVQELMDHKYRIVESNRNEDEEADEAKAQQLEQERSAEAAAAEENAAGTSSEEAPADEETKSPVD
ncbi:MAG: DNA-directed RNA polymerase subunit omega [Oscillospiraceae bacterium]|jgi:DNA-directed RNA polymerase subunit omega|nr:DNA-directed RNA polymerase subunit omega [Oscillospiraceae bacterium]MDD3261464.1 DNA-directed RNA polymerase subunit omega [Oscillospiraceae bacterium]